MDFNDIDPRIVDLALQELPQLVGFFRGLFAAKHPTAPPPTETEIFYSLEQAYRSSIAIDSDWLRHHPETAPPASSPDPTGDSTPTA